jgi:hypothetical protein
LDERMKSNFIKNLVGILNNLSSSMALYIYYFIILFSIIFILIFNKQVYIELAKEGANAEFLTAFFYFLTGILFLIKSYIEFKAYKSFRKICFLLLFGLFFIFISG